jgi:hypothetical protein
MFQAQQPFEVIHTGEWETGELSTFCHIVKKKTRFRFPVHLSFLAPVPFYKITNALFLPQAEQDSYARNFASLFYAVASYA